MLLGQRLGRGFRFVAPLLGCGCFGFFDLLGLVGGDASVLSGNGRLLRLSLLGPLLGEPRLLVLGLPGLPLISSGGRNPVRIRVHFDFNDVLSPPQAVKC